MKLQLYNSLSRQKEEFLPLHKGSVGMYTCGPTVYDNATIGNFRTYVTADLLARTLKYNGFEVKHVMNLTDVGHLTGDNEGDADTGEDRLERASKREGKTAWDVAKFYGDSFLEQLKELNISTVSLFPKATDHIKEQVELIQELAKKGLTYKTSDGVYFDTKKFEEDTGKKYGALSDLDKIKEGARVAKNIEKKNKRDFALWKFSHKGGRGFDSKKDDAALARHMEWKSPWGVGFPGWHIECSAMSMKYLGETFDIHVGGEDLKQTHHPNEIAQSEGVTGRQFVRYWVHGTFLRVEGKRMGKSLGNVYTLSDIKKKGIDPLALRYLFLSAHYKDALNFTWKSLEGANTALGKLKSLAGSLKSESSRKQLSPEKMAKIEDYANEFDQVINDNLNTPKALAVLWGAVKSNIPNEDKYDLMMSFDEVLGLNLNQVSSIKYQVPNEIQELASKREMLREKGKYEEADKVRQDIEKKGYTLKDSSDGTIVQKV